MSTSEISGFYKRSAQDRWKIVQEFGGRSDEGGRTLGGRGAPN